MRTSEFAEGDRGSSGRDALMAAQAQATIAYNFPTGLAGNQTTYAKLLLGNEFVVNSANQRDRCRCFR